jgi:hypothetical protein
MSWTLGIRALVSVDSSFRRVRPWFKSEVDIRNLREESNITATLMADWEAGTHQLR